MQEPCTWEEFRLLLDSDKLLVIDVYADWCGPCHSFSRSFENVAADLADIPEIVFLCLNLDNTEFREYLTGFGIDGIPTLLLIRNKVVAMQQAGACPKREIFRAIAFVVSACLADPEDPLLQNEVLDAKIQSLIHELEEEAIARVKQVAADQEDQEEPDEAEPESVEIDEDETEE